jgi:hypothetical protein
MLQSSYAPVIVLLATSALGAELRNAVLAALGLSTTLLAGLGYEAARRSGAPVAAALGWTAGTALLGVAIIGLKYAPALTSPVRPQPHTTPVPLLLGNRMRRYHGDPERLELDDDAVQVRLVEHLTVDDRLRWNLGDPHVAERGPGLVRQPTFHPELVVHHRHRLVSGRGPVADTGRRSPGHPAPACRTGHRPARVE